MADSTLARLPVKRVLKPPPKPSSDVHSTKTSKSEVQFILPGSLPDPDVLRVNTSSVPQPFLEPSILEKWR
ncbi:hypothetical protein PT974_06078 [Cladobotryum mycophilum]|uniref:Uncharacterized protein n=1 Tax=Cladobotryum mycophilum TaxID=491253 RepID=A0ABR0SKJ6_9HYPO